MKGNKIDQSKNKKEGMRVSYAFQNVLPKVNYFRMSNLCRIQYASDLHLEFYDKQAFPHLLRPCARILALAGDIGRPDHRLYPAFFEWAHDKWDHIFVVAGNHEHYNKKHYYKWEKEVPQTMEERLDMCREICSKWSNVHFLEKNQVYLPEYNTAVLGTTLWTKIEEGDMPRALHAMNDYNFIARKGDDNKPRRFWPSDCTRLHKESVQWLDARIHEWEEQQKHVVVLTHHMPTYSLISEQYKDHPANFCFTTNLDHMLRSPIRAWICGHSHQQKTLEIQRDDPPTSEGSTIVAINAYGYNIKEQYGYSAERVISFDCKQKEPPPTLA